LPSFTQQDKSAEMLGRLIHAFDQLQGRRTYHMLGNHCLYNLPRPQLNEMLQIPAAADGASYYSFSPHPAWRFVIIDAYDISLLGWPDDHPRHLQAQAILDRENPNQVSMCVQGCSTGCSFAGGQRKLCILSAVVS
jgi:manganese-dependent ADP-ribose/CDP-alcohol diphosphatase